MKRAHLDVAAMTLVAIVAAVMATACSVDIVAAGGVTEERANNIRTILDARGIENRMREVDATPARFDVLVDEADEFHAKYAIEDGRYVAKPVFYGATVPRTPEVREKARAVEAALLKAPGVVRAHVALLTPVYPGAEKAPWVHVGIVYVPVDEHGTAPAGAQAREVERLVAAMTDFPEQSVIINSLRCSDVRCGSG